MTMMILYNANVFPPTIYKYNDKGKKVTAEQSLNRR